MPNVNEDDQQQDDAKLALLRAAIDEGDLSGIAEGDPFARARQELGIED